MRVAFVYVPIGHETFEENLRVVDEDFGRLPPLGLAYAAAIADRAGHAVILVDANARRVGLDVVTRELQAWKPDLLAFTLSTYMFRRTTDWMIALRTALGVPTVAGGVQLHLYPDVTLRHPAVDYGVVHFGLRGFPALLDALEKGHDPAGLPEVVARGRDGTIVRGPVDHRPNPYLDLPLPARHLLPNQLYHSIISQRRDFTVAVTSTGCNDRCRYCAIPARKRYLNPVDRVLEEVRNCHAMGIREIDFFDADFFAGRHRAREMCQALAGAGLDLEWSCRASLDRLDRETLRLARTAGCRQIYVGIETPDADALTSLRKRLSPSRVAERLCVMKDEGIRALGFFMIGVPGETHASALRTIRYALELPLDYAQFSRMIAKPGSDLHRELVDRTGRDYWEDLVSGQPVPPRVPNLWSHLGEGAIEAYTKLAYLAFYFRPRYVVSALGRMRTRDELLRSARTSIRMLGT